MNRRQLYKRIHPTARIIMIMGLGICIGATTPSTTEGIITGIVYIAVGWFFQNLTK